MTMLIIIPLIALIMAIGNLTSLIWHNVSLPQNEIVSSVIKLVVSLIVFFGMWYAIDPEIIWK